MADEEQGKVEDGQAGEILPDGEKENIEVLSGSPSHYGQGPTSQDVESPALDNFDKAVGSGDHFLYYFKKNPRPCSSDICGSKRGTAIALGTTEICDKTGQTVLFASQTPKTGQVLLVDAATGVTLLQGSRVGSYKFCVSAESLTLGTIEECGKGLKMHCGCRSTFRVLNPKMDELYHVAVPKQNGVQGCFRDPIILKMFSPLGMMMGQMEKICVTEEGETKCHMKLTLPPGINTSTRALLIFTAHSVFCNYFANSGGGTWYGYKGIQKRRCLGTVLWSLLAVILVIALGLLAFFLTQGH